MSKTSTKSKSLVSSDNKKSNNFIKSVKAWIMKEIWNGRPVHWLAIFLAYLAMSYTSYQIAVYYINIPELNGIIAFIATITIGSRLIKSK